MDYEMECGCEYIDHGFDASSTGINFCSLHKAARALKEAVDFALGCVDGSRRDYANELVGRLQLAADFADDITHASDCGLHSEPAYPVKPCSCGIRKQTL